MTLLLLFLPMLGAIEAVGQWGRGRRAEAVVAGLITVLGITYSLGVAWEWSLPNPATLMAAFLQPMRPLPGLR